GNRPVSNRLLWGGLARPTTSPSPAGRIPVCRFARLSPLQSVISPCHSRNSLQTSTDEGRPHPRKLLRGVLRRMSQITGSHQAPVNASPPRVADAEVTHDPDPAIETRGLRMRYGTNDVLHGVDLSVDRGEVVALLGPNGAGKTTTIEILEGFRRRSAGQVRVLGTDPDDGDEAWRARLGVVLQSWRDHRRWRVRELLAYLGRFYAPYSTSQRPRPYDPDELIARVGLSGQATTALAKLSGGQRRRLDVAIGLVG